MHDWCYTTTSCRLLEYNLPYFVPYKWKCNGGAPYCSELLSTAALQWSVELGARLREIFTILENVPTRYFHTSLMIFASASQCNVTWLVWFRHLFSVVS